MPETDPIVAFVEGDISPQAFEAYAYGSGFEALAAGEPAPAYAKNVDSLYTYIIGLSFTSPGDLLSMQAALREFLERTGHTVTPTREYDSVYAVFLAAKPAWLEVPDTYLRTLLAEAGNRQGRDLQDWLKTELRLRFRYLKRPPSWLQSPQWPLRNGHPLVFAGQVDAGVLFHDRAFFYLFFDPETGNTEVVTQTA